MSNINIVGSREEGKTTLALWLARRDHEGVAVFDPRAMIPGVIVGTPDELEAAIKARAWKDGPLVYRFDSTDTNGKFDEFCAVLFPPQFTLGGFSCVVDEAGGLQTANSIHPGLYRAIKQHPTMPPNESVTLIQTNHRLAEFHGISKALMNDLYCFRQQTPRDLLALEEHTGTNELYAVVPNLPRHHCVRYRYGRVDQGQQQWELWDQPDVWGPKSISATPAADSRPSVPADPPAPNGESGIVVPQLRETEKGWRWTDA